MQPHFHNCTLQNSMVGFVKFLAVLVTSNWCELHVHEQHCLEFLKVKASPGIYNSIYPKIQKIARQLNVVLNPDFGVRPKIVRPDMVETAASLNSIEVR